MNKSYVSTIDWGNMRKRFFSLIVILACLFNSISSFAQQVKNKQQIEGTPTNIVKEVNKREDAPRTVGIRLVESFVERASSFENLQFKTILMARLANLLWSFDREFAKNTFIKAIDILDVNKGTDVEKNKMVSSLRRQVVSLLAQHDPDLASKYAAGNDPVETKPLTANESIRAALDQVNKDPNAALQYANQSLQTGISSGLAYFLKELRQKNKPAADSLFLKVLDRVNQQTLIDGNQFLLLGTYLFTSPRLRAEGSPGGDLNTMAQIGVGNLIVYDITEDRPNISPGLIRAYLSTANQLIMRASQSPDEKQKRLYHAIGYLLLPKAEKYAPELSPALQSGMQQLAGQLPPDATSEDVYRNFSKDTPKSLDEQLANIEKMPGDERRDARYLLLVYRFWQQGNIENARRVASKISSLEVSSKLKTLIDFAEAGKVLKSGDKDSYAVEKIISKIPLGVESSLLWLALARATSKTADKDRFSFFISQSLNSVWKVNDNRRAFLLLSIVGQLAPTDPSYAKQILSEAVNNLNADLSDTPPKWEQEVKAGDAVVKFSLSSVVNPGKGFSEAIPDLAIIDPQGTSSIISELKKQDQLGSALLVTATAILK